METLRIKKEQELGTVVETVLERVRSARERQNDGEAVVLALQGELGAGKTTFMQQLARALGVSDTVTSPTFVLMKKYQTTDDNIEQLVHIDAYRIEDVDEMQPLRFAEELQQNNSLIAIEWAERIDVLLPKETIWLTIVIEGEERLITLH